MNNYSCLDLDKVKEEIAKFAAIDDSKNNILNEIIDFNPLVINRKISETKELLELIKKDFIISFDGIININNIIDKANKNIVLDPLECSKILNFHNHCERIKKLFYKVNNELNIRDYSDSIIIVDNLKNELNKVVDNNGILKKDASEKLKEIIHNIEINEKRLYDQAHNFIQKHQDSLQESSIYLRNNRVTFLIKNSDKNKYNGYTYGTSASGLASYVEPEFLINLNNNKLSLEEDKQEEINRILQKLTYLISQNSDIYKNNYEILINLDVVYAKACYGYNNACEVGNVSNQPLIIKNVCHPLIDKNSVVSNTYTLDKKYKGIVISGTNTGGKTVGLKVIGLSVLMTYLGIPIIAEEANIPYYDNVYVDIDDNQSISNSLSTFSAHIANINEILNNATSKSLILIDELISGTDPKEAQAISLAILNKIEEIGANFIVTTHYDDVKNYSYNNDDILLSSVGFNTETLKPTYKYIENSVGASNAIEVASRYFTDENIIINAKNYFKASTNKETELLNKLAEEINKNQLLIEQNKELVSKNSQLNTELNDKINNFEKEKINIKNKYIDELNIYFEQLKEEYIEKLNNAKEETKIEKIFNEKTLNKTTNNEKITFNINDNVKVGDGDRIGFITNIKGNNVEVNINGINIKTNINNLTKMPKIKETKFTVKQQSTKTTKREINVVGYRVDDALLEIDRYLNNATQARIEQVKIIHGIGTGQLRSAIREYLKKNHNVKEYNDGDYYDGGSAVTMVKLK